MPPLIAESSRIMLTRASSQEGTREASLPGLVNITRDLHGPIRRLFGSEWYTRAMTHFRLDPVAPCMPSEILPRLIHISFVSRIRGGGVKRKRGYRTSLYCWALCLPREVSHGRETITSFRAASRGLARAPHRTTSAQLKTVHRSVTRGASTLRRQMPI